VKSSIQTDPGMKLLKLIAEHGDAGLDLPGKVSER
jgi:hypothetical protein